MPLGVESDPSGSGEKYRPAAPRKVPRRHSVKRGTVEQIAASAAHTGRPRRRWEERTAADSTTGRASHTARPACFLFLPTPSQPRRTRCRAACALLDHIAALRIGSPWEDLSAAPMRTPPTRRAADRAPPPLPISCPDALHSSQQQPAALPAPTGAARPMSTPRPREVL